MTDLKFIHCLTDFGFKKIFGEEFSKDLLIDFLNEIIKDEKIKDLTYLNNEQLGKTKDERKAVFDLYCENEKGDKFLVELQKVRQDFFVDRTIFYATFPIRQQSVKGEWNFNLKSVYTISIMDFLFADDPQYDTDPRVQRTIMLMDTETNEVFYDKLKFIYLEMPKFNKTEDELETHYDKWLYVLKNLGSFSKRPAKLQERIFQKVFDIAEIAALNEEDFLIYNDHIRNYWDWNAIIRTARREGSQEGRVEGHAEGHAEGRKEGIQEGELLARQKIAKRLKQKGESAKRIAELTGLSESDHSPKSVGKI